MIQDDIQKLAYNVCLFCCYYKFTELKCGNAPLTLSLLLKLLSQAYEEGIIDNECTVLDAVKLLRRFGLKANVIKVPVKSLEEVKELAPVRFDYNGKSHWVLVQNGKVVFNSLSSSVCVKNGKPSTMRSIIIL